MNASAPTDTRWLRRFHAADRAPVRLVCFPHAGGAAGFYHSFSRALSPAVEVVAVQYPGRQDRRSEPALDDIAALTDGIIDALGPILDERPLALFGHSMGAVLAYETARRLEHEVQTPCALLFASGRRAPSRRREEYTHLKDDDGLVEELRSLDGTDAELLDDADVLRLVLPAVRVDYRAVETYRHRAGPEPSCPVAVLRGADDPKVTREEAEAWRDHTTGLCTLDTFPGGHFFLREAQADVVGVVRARLRPLSPLGVGRTRPQGATGRPRGV
ncbi:thioesterase II family protein [Streptomyces sp. NPDC005931]|uniref:thioesterase II family protein n=1 Tax=Streptomyces sp. NPDC005931 TaxID=3364737 RepID=UPI0036C006C9